MKSLRIISFIMVIFILMSCGGRSSYKLSKKEKETYLFKGKNITAKGFEILSTELQKTLQNEGFESAIPYCHLKAVLLIDSIAEPYNVDVSRISLKNRNQENAPDALETEILEEYAVLLKEGKQIGPKVIAVNEKEALYCSPIFIKPTCLLCHGTVGKEVTQNALDLIIQYYPEDQATGYDENDIRGMWTVRFKRDV